MPKRAKPVKQDQYAKLKELILYIAEKCQYRKNFGATMLNKILFFSDFIAYAQLGESITGTEYFKLEWGPAPKYLVPAREQLLEEGLIVIQKNPTMRGMQERVVPTGIRTTNLDLFTGRQISLVDKVIASVRRADARSVSGLSHRFYGWQIAQLEETIPYQTVYLREPGTRQIPKAVKRRIDQITRER